MAGFFGLHWLVFSCNGREVDADDHRTNNATIEVIIEEDKFNNSLAGSLSCPNAYPTATGNEARDTWIHKYLQDGKFNMRLASCLDVQNEIQQC